MKNVYDVISDFYDWLVKNQHQKSGKATSYKNALIYAADFYKLKNYEDIFLLNRHLNDSLSENFKNTNKQSYFSKGFYVAALKQLQKYFFETGIFLHSNSIDIKIYKKNRLFRISDIKRGSEKQCVRNFLAEKYGSEPPFDVPKTSKRNTRCCVKELLNHETNNFFNSNKSQTSNPPKIINVRAYYRDPKLANIVKNMTNECPICKRKIGPDILNEIPELQCHHIIFLSHGGTDTLDNCQALCPNCHRRIHINDKD